MINYSIIIRFSILESYYHRRVNQKLIKCLSRYTLLGTKYVYDCHKFSLRVVEYSEHYIRTNNLLKFLIYLRSQNLLPRSGGQNLILKKGPTLVTRHEVIDHTNSCCCNS